MGRQSGNLHLLMDSLIQLGRIELALGRPADAKACFEEAIAAFVALETVHSNRVGAALLGLGWTALATGDYGQGRAVLSGNVRCARLCSLGDHGRQCRPGAGPGGNGADQKVLQSSPPLYCRRTPQPMQPESISTSCWNS